MTFKLKLIFGLFILTFFSYGQTSRLKITVLDKKTKQAVGDREMTLTINDTLTKTLKLNADGEAEPILINGGFYKINVSIIKYKTLVLKEVGVDEARGRTLVIKMDPIIYKR